MNAPAYPTYETELRKILEKDDRVVVMTAENRAAIRNLPPLIGKRFIDVGIAEMTMIGAAAGLALRGRRPIVHALATFLTLRAFEFIRTDLGIGQLPSVLVGGVAGFLSRGQRSHASGDRRRVAPPGHPPHAGLLPRRRGRARAGASRAPRLGLAHLRAAQRDEAAGLAPHRKPRRAPPLRVRQGGDRRRRRRCRDPHLRVSSSRGARRGQAAARRGALGEGGQHADACADRHGGGARVTQEVARDAHRRGSLPDRRLYSIVAELCLANRIAPKVVPMALAAKWFKPTLLAEVLRVEGFTAAAIAERASLELGHEERPEARPHQARA